MKYIRKFNETRLETELDDFCKDYLANSMDELGYIVYSREYKNYCSIQLLSNNRKIYWRNIKDDFIPFIEMLRGSYVLTPLYSKYYFNVNGEYFEDLRISNNKPAESILFHVKK